MRLLMVAGDTILEEQHHETDQHENQRQADGKGEEQQHTEAGSADADTAEEKNERCRTWDKAAAHAERYEVS